MTVDRAFARTVLARLRVGVLANTLRTPTAAVLIVALLIRLTGLTWGLPASDGWDDDGVAPRDFLAGVVMTYWPHHHYIYPPLQLIALTLVSAPVWVAALLRASSLEAGELVRAFIQVPTMTALAVAARATTIAMSLGLLWNVAKIAVDLTHSRRAGAWAAAACGVNAVFTYYSQTTNLDVPYLFWAVLALRTWMTAVVRGDLPRLRRVPVIAALAVATKDQAYALFVLGLPLALGAWLLVDRRARASARAIFRELAIGAAMGLSLLLVVDGAVSNPSGFAERIGTLLGSASQDHAYYAKTWLGRGKAILDTFTAFHEYYPWAFVPFAAFGCWVAFAAKDPARRAAGLTPLCFALSFTVAFNMAARRTEHRFVLPQAMMWGIYAGIGFDALHSRIASARIAGWVAAACLAMGLYRCVAVDVAMAFDPRYDAERWLRDHARPGDRIEAYGNNVHLLRFPSNADIERVDPAPLAGRNPLPGVTEVTDRFSNVEARRPRFIVVSEFWADRYLWDRADLETNSRVLTQQESALLADDDSRSYFRALRDGRLAYRQAHVSTWASHIWPRIDIHESLSLAMWIFERNRATEEPSP